MPDDNMGLVGGCAALAPSDPIQAAVDAVTGKKGIEFAMPGPMVSWRRRQHRRLPNGAITTYTHPAVATYGNLAKVMAEKAMDGRPPFDGPIDLQVIEPLGAGFSGVKTVRNGIVRRSI